MTNDGPVRFCLDVGSYQKQKRKQMVRGDTFVSRRIREEKRSIAVLSDGLGSGVKANVLSSLTATMALNYTAGFRDVRKTAETIIQTLPVCSQRLISYATFCIVDVDSNAEARIINYGSPAPVLIRYGEPVTLDFSTIEGSVEGRAYALSFTRMPVTFGDRVILVSDGVSQAGLGSSAYPLGWCIDEAARFAAEAIGSGTRVFRSQVVTDDCQPGDGT
jgi:serine phosphatase RsbU (regulator of sigma subunit)